MSAQFAAPKFKKMDAFRFDATAGSNYRREKFVLQKKKKETKGYATSPGHENIFRPRTSRTKTGTIFIILTCDGRLVRKARGDSSFSESLS